MIGNLKQWAIAKLFGFLPDKQEELWKWSYTHNVMHESWTREDFPTLIEKATEGVYCVPVLSEEYCDWLIEQAEALDAWSVDKKDNYAASELNLGKIHHGFIDNYHRQIVVLQNLGARVFTGLYGWRPEKIERCFLIKYQVSDIDSMKRHHDENSLISMSINLNDDFEGGELSFIRTPADRVSPKKGWGAVFAGNPTMAHQAHPTTAGVRYVLVYWIN